MFKYKSNAREHQDFFVLAMLNKKRYGTYLEVGGARPIVDNNTYLLENDFGWEGCSLEWSGDLSSEWIGIRKNPCLCADATLMDYDELLKQCNFGNHIDYLQLDIDPPHNTFKALLKINFFKYSFSVITYEHDWYAGGDFERIASRKILESFGYTLVVSDVMHDDIRFEDWYINPRYVSEDTYRKFIGTNVTLNPTNIDINYKKLFLDIGL
jgi:hypothetical protein